MHKTHKYEKGMFANKDNIENTTRFFYKKHIYKKNHKGIGCFLEISGAFILCYNENKN